MVFEKDVDPRFVELNELDEKDCTEHDFLSLLSGSIAVTQRESILKAAEDFRKASGEIEQMYKRAMRSMK
uniref:Vps5 domain-containing protein n=1 Tax=Angiostrongylus cantonensis TaxID=6313 RepID=A0A0K0D4G9_ANGCA